MMWWVGVLRFDVNNNAIIFPVVLFIKVCGRLSLPRAFYVSVSPILVVVLSVSGSLFSRITCDMRQKRNYSQLKSEVRELLVHKHVSVSHIISIVVGKQ